MKKKKKTKKSSMGIIQFEILCEYHSVLFAKSTHRKNEKTTEELEKLRHKIYHKDFNLQTVLRQLDKIKGRLEKNK